MPDSPAKVAFGQAVRARAQEIAADQEAAKVLIKQAITELRDKGYPREFVKSTLEGFIYYNPACTQRDWPGQGADHAG